MAIFGRKFPVGGLRLAVLEEKENAWLCDMLRCWHPSGDAVGKRREDEGGERLRLAIRDGYLNFYRAGRSIARVGFDRKGKLWGKIHNKYIGGGAGYKDQEYVPLTSLVYDRKQLSRWIAKANCYPGGTEKRFVDRLVANNPDIIDLEIAISVPFEGARQKTRAVRMDLVALEPIGEPVGERWRVVFWEVKLVGDGRARCEGPAVLREKPEVLKQMAAYTDWLEQPANERRVAEAFQCNCRLLVDLHSIARQLRPDVEELGSGIRAVAAPGAPLPSIDVKPRLLIYDCTGDAAFIENGHLMKLQCAGFHVQMVQRDDQMALDTLPCP